MANKGILKHFAVIGVGTVINMLLGLLSTPVITRIVDPEAYGQFSIINTYSSIAIMILCVGLDQALVRFYYEKKELSYKRGLVFQCTALPIVGTLIVSVLILFMIKMGILHFEFPFDVTIFLCIYTFIKILYRFSQLVVRLEYDSKLYSALNVISKSLYIAGAFLFLRLLKDKQLLALVFALISESIVTLIISIIAHRNVWKFNEIKRTDLLHSLKELCVYGYPFIFSMGLMTLFQAIDKFSLNHYRTYAEVGIYASANTLISVFAIVQTTFNALWAPMAVERFSEKPEDVSFHQKGNKIITVVMFTIGLFLILFRNVFSLLLGAKYREAAFIVPFLVFNPIMYTISETTVSGIVFAKKSKAHIIVTLAACLTNLLGNTILVPIYGCQGAAISTGMSYIVFFTIRTFLSNKYFYIDFGLTKFYVLTIATAIYALYCSFHSFDVISVIGFFVCTGILIGLYYKEFIWIINYSMKEVINPIISKRKRHEK